MNTMGDEESLKASIFQRLHPRIYFERFVSENLRPDGREFNVWRDVSINVGSISTANGSALVRLGNTTIVCGVKAEITWPGLDAPDRGFIIPNLDLPAICSPRFKPGPPTEEAQVLSERLNSVLTSPGVLPLESLCIESGKAVWALYIDATCINYDGNPFDATLIAMIAALRNTRLPRATYNPEANRTICSPADLVSLALNRTPISMSFGIFTAEHPCLLSDPTSFEEPLLETTITVIIDEKDRLLSVSQIGVDPDALIPCISAARLRHKEILEKLK